MDIIYQDDSLVVVNKTAGLPVVPDKTGDLSAKEWLENIMGFQLFSVNRLDRPTSGLVLFATSAKAMAAFSSLWKSKQIHKKYLVAVRNQPPKKKDQLKHFLFKRNNKAYVSRNGHPAKEAILDYQIIGKTDHYFILEINLHTGRFHQIRAQLAHIGCPVKGDVKYGDRRSNKDRSIHLHSWKTDLIHPITGNELILEAPLPDDPVWNNFVKF